MTALVVAVLAGVILLAYRLGVESGRVDRLLEHVRLRAEVGELREHLAAAEACIDTCVCSHDAVEPLSDSEFRAWQRIVEEER